MIATKVTPQGWKSRLGDYLMLPLMYLLQFPSFDSPQRTHFWNNKKFEVAEIDHLDSDLFVSMPGAEGATERWLGILPIFHMPIIGGWKKFIVVEPTEPQDAWFIGWIPSDLVGISQIPLSGPVRLLRGPRNVFFFGVNENGDQIKLTMKGEGVLGKAGEYKKVILL